jgi:hypothetical protein
MVKGKAVRYGNQSLVPASLIDAMGKDWKKVLAGNAFSGISRHPEWDGQAVSFRFTPIVEDDKEIGIEVQSYFDTEEKQ